MKEENSFNSTYLGIVVQNNDPEFRGRVKVWVPHVSATVYEKINKSQKDLSFKFPGGNIKTDLSADLLEELKTVLPWAEQITPIIGASGTGRYNAFSDKFSISDSNKLSTTQKFDSEEDSKFAKYKLNNDSIGEKPARVFEPFDMRVSDAFADTSQSFSNRFNKFAYNYVPSSYSNCSKGSFSIPNVGCHVWVQFRDGNHNVPIYYGNHFGQYDWLSIFNPLTQGEKQLSLQDYPGFYENLSEKDRDIDDYQKEIYRNKYVFNQKGAAIEIINTDGRESFKVTHYKGAFLEFNNRTGTLFLPNNFQRLILEDEFDTIRGYKNSYIEKDFDSIIRGDYYLKIGKINFKAQEEWYKIFQEIHNLKKELVPNAASILATIQAKTLELAAAEASMGNGGSYISTIAKNKIETIGLVFNSLQSYKEDTKKIDYLIDVDDTSATSYTISQYNIPNLKYVHMSDFPGGTFTQQINHKYNLIVGSGGVNIKSTGNIDISGTILNILGKRITIGTPNTLDLRGGKLISLEGDIITIKHKLENAQVYIDRNLGVKNNVDIGNNINVHKDSVVGQDERIARDSTIGRDQTVRRDLRVNRNVLIDGVFSGGGVVHTIEIVGIPSTADSDGDTHIHNGQNWQIRFVS